MIYRAVGRLAAFDLSVLNKDVSGKALEILRGRGFKTVNVDLPAIARNWVGSEAVKYRRGAKMSEAPNVVNCSSFVKWLYEMRGVWIPRKSVDQRDFGLKVKLSELQPEDLLFKTRTANHRSSYFDKDPNDGVGHVGMFTGKGTVIHAVNSTPPIVEIPLMAFLADKDKFRGAVRIVQNPEKTLTLKIPPTLEIETSQDIKWLVLGH